MCGAAKLRKYLELFYAGFSFHIFTFSPAGIGKKYPLSKVNYDISLDIFPTCTFADTQPPDATKIRPAMIYNSTQNAPLPL